MQGYESVMILDPEISDEAQQELIDKYTSLISSNGGQVVHHVADSHMNGFVRLKLALTEENPTIKPYDERRWAELADMTLPIDLSLAIVDSVHARWDAVYRSMAPAQFTRTFFHPELKETLTLDTHVQLYGWHSRHHVGHITALRAREGW